MKKLLFCLLFSGLSFATPKSAQQLPEQPVASSSQYNDSNEFDAMAEEMDAQGLTNTIEIKEPSAFQLFIRRAGGPIVMAYVKMREKMSAFWAWLWTKKKRKAQI